MRRVARVIQRSGRAVLGRADALCNALYGWRYNPLYHSGALVVACFVVLFATGIYLLLFYRIGAPYGSVERITGQVYAGRWIRSLHRYVSDLAVLAVVIHAVRMFVQDRAWGRRALAWISGVFLTVAFVMCGWTGYVMVWDVQAQVFAVEGGRLFDFLPIFSEPIGRTFVGERPMPGAFFFLNYFAHIAIPVGIVLMLWVHLSRLARTRILPPRPLLWGVVALFTALSIAWPVSMAPEADLLRLPTEVPFDVFYGFWFPFTRSLPAGWAWLLLLSVHALALAVPLLTRPPVGERPAPSFVDPRLCTGCEQCYHDCPYEAISMVRRDDGRDGFVGLVDPVKCVSCGICAGSCAPMGVGPRERTGRDQLEQVTALIREHPPSEDAVVLVGCENSAAGPRRGERERPPQFAISCVGALHTSVIEYLIRAGAGGVMVVACPPRDCWNREGVTWFEERAFRDREAELQARVDRRRLRVVHLAEYESSVLMQELEAYRADIGSLADAEEDGSMEIDRSCVVPEVSVAEDAGP